MRTSVVRMGALLALVMAAGAEARCPNYAPLKQAFFGDLHTHTSYSLDAYTFGTRNDPAFAFSSARAEGLDFDAVTDHSESLASAYGCVEDETNPFYSDPFCSDLRNGIEVDAVDQPCNGFTDNTATGCIGEQAEAWQSAQDAAAAANDHCHFTAFKGYEWTKAIDAPGHRITLHQNVIFRTSVVPALPFDALDFETAPGMWAALSAQCHAGIGCEAITIPHNMNESQGNAFNTWIDTLAGPQPYTAVDLNRMLKYRRLVELHQHKGNSECLTDRADTGALSACNFEVVSDFALPRDLPGYARVAMKAGLERFAGQGYTDVKIGFVGATDSHNSTPGHVDETTYVGHTAGRDDSVEKRLAGNEPRNNPGGITGVWAEENTRDSIFAALKRRETFGTSGPRIRVRFFQNVGATAPCVDPDFPARIVANGGVPMGGTLHDTGSPPEFVIHALPDVAPIDFIDIVKASVVGGSAVEKVYTLSPGGVLPNCTTWTDPDFDPAEPAFWYVRVREAPTWRWSHYDCEALRVSRPDWETVAPGCGAGGDLDVMVRERAWTSAIWHLPGGPVPIQTTSMTMLDASVFPAPERRKFRFVSKTRRDMPANRIVVPGVASPGDPTQSGATLTIYNPDSGETFTQTLDSGDWTRNPSGTRYTYTGSSTGVQQVQVANDRIVVRAGGMLFGYSLDEPRQGTIALRLQLGSAMPWCAEAHPKTSGSLEVTTAWDRTDRFIAGRKTPPPDQCPVL